MHSLLTQKVTEETTDIKMLFMPAADLGRWSYLG